MPEQTSTQPTETAELKARIELLEEQLESLSKELADFKSRFRDGLLHDAPVATGD